MTKERIEELENKPDSPLEQLTYTYDDFKALIKSWQPHVPVERNNWIEAHYFILMLNIPHLIEEIDRLRAGLESIRECRSSESQCTHREHNIARELLEGK